MFAALREKSLIPVFFKVSIDRLFDNLESGKRIVDSKICVNLK